MPLANALAYPATSLPVATQPLVQQGHHNFAFACVEQINHAIDPINQIHRNTHRQELHWHDLTSFLQIRQFQILLHAYTLSGRLSFIESITQS